MIYLADKDPNSKFLPKDTRKRAEVISWLMFQMVTPFFSCTLQQSPVLLMSCSSSIECTVPSGGHILLQLQRLCILTFSRRRLAVRNAPFLQHRMNSHSVVFLAGRSWSHARSGKPLCKIRSGED